MKKTCWGTIAIDLDGVVCDFESEFCDVFGRDNRHLPNLHERYPNVDTDIITEFIQSESTYKRLFPLFGGILLLNQAKQNNWNVLILTSRPKHLSEVTRTWVDEWTGHYYNIWFAYNKKEAIEYYNSMCPNEPIKFLVDDLVHNIEKLPNRVTGVVWEQPWNVGFSSRARYNEQNMTIEISDTVSNWKPIWEMINK